MLLLKTRLRLPNSNAKKAFKLFFQAHFINMRVIKILCISSVELICFILNYIWKNVSKTKLPEQSIYNMSSEINSGYYKFFFFVNSFEKFNLQQ